MGFIVIGIVVTVFIMGCMAQSTGGREYLNRRADLGEETAKYFKQLDKTRPKKKHRWFP